MGCQDTVMAASLSQPDRRPQLGIQELACVCWRRLNALNWPSSLDIPGAIDRDQHTSASKQRCPRKVGKHTLGGVASGSPCTLPAPAAHAHTTTRSSWFTSGLPCPFCSHTLDWACSSLP
eukprot:1152622-Pelagomonas_calceolata.AAC.1